MSSIVFGPQGYSQPPIQVPVPTTVSADLVLPQPQPTFEVTSNTAHDGAGTSKDDTDEQGGANPNGERRGRLLDIKS
jgi:hypothetical protein